MSATKSFTKGVPYLETTSYIITRKLLYTVHINNHFLNYPSLKPKKQTSPPKPTLLRPLQGVPAAVFAGCGAQVSARCRWHPWPDLLGFAPTRSHTEKRTSPEIFPKQNPFSKAKNMKIFQNPQKLAKAGLEATQNEASWSSWSCQAALSSVFDTSKSHFLSFLHFQRV